MREFQDSVKNKNTVKNNAKLFICLLVFLVALIFTNAFFADRYTKADFMCFSDATGTLTVDKVITDKQSEFQEMKDRMIIAANSKSAYWVQFNLEQVPEDQNILLINNACRLEQADLYYIGADKRIHLTGQNDWKPSATIPISKEMRNGDIYLRLKTPVPYVYSLSLLSEEQAGYIGNIEIIFLFAMAGALAVSSLYSAAVLLPLLNRISYAYFFTLVAACLFVTNHAGLIQRIIPEAAALFGKPIGFSLGFVYMIAGLIYFKLFFNMRPKYPLANIVANLLIFSNIIGTGMVFTAHYAAVEKLNIITTSFGGVFFIFVALYAYSRGDLYSKNVFFATISIFIGLAFYFWPLIFGISINVYAVLACPGIAQIFATILMADAIRDRIKAIKGEEAQKRAFITHLDGRSNVKTIAANRAAVNQRVLFNALEKASDLCDTDPKKAILVMENLSDYLNYHFNFGEVPFVSVTDELKALDTYIKLEKYGADIAFDVEYIIDDGLSLAIPPVILQPIVENSIIHGFETGKGGYKITIKILEYEGKCVISITDNGKGMSSERKNEVLLQTIEGETYRLAQIDQLLDKLYGKQLKIISQIDKGTEVSFELPKGGEITV